MIDHLVTLKKSFSLLSLNSQSIHAKIGEIQIFLHNLSKHGFYFDVLCFQETWMASDHDESQIQLDNYTCITKGKSISEHGGLAIYINSEYNFKILDSAQTNSYENLFIQIEHSKFRKPLIIGNIYRPPQSLNSNISTFTEDLSATLRTLNQSNVECVLAGDFNIDLLKVSEKPLFNDYLTTIISEGFLPKITLPTRFSSRSATLIDNFLCKLSDHYSPTFSGILTNHISDHQPYFITLDYLQKQTHHHNQISFEIKKPNFYSNIKIELQNLNLITKLNHNPNFDPNENLLTLQNLISSAVKKNISIKTSKLNKHKHPRSEWITPAIIRSIRFRDDLHLKLKRSTPGSTENENLKINLKTFNKILKKTIKEAKINYYQEIFNSCHNDSKATWKHINNILNRNRNSSSSLPEKLLFDNNEITNKQEIINSFNTHFSQIGKKIANSMITSSADSYGHYLTNPTTNCFTFREVTREAVKKCISELASKTSTAADGISSKLLKYVSDEISEPLALIINQCFSTGVFPDNLKLARVKPLFKKGNTFDPGNYRPISILPALSKIFEKLILKQVTQYFNENQLLYQSQYGFRKGHSTEHAVLELVDHIYSKIDNGESPISIFVDLTKAFDCLDHKILFKKLEYYGVRGSSLKLLQNYLTNRKQFTECDSIKSDLGSITTGVPQGSNLGPFLFLVYLNDIQNCSSQFKIINYADDSTFISSFNSTQNEQLINAELEKVQNWLQSNKLSMNISKTKFMLFHSPKKQVVTPALKINDQPIESVDNFVYLGISINKNLSWKIQTDKIARKISKIICVLSKLKNTIPTFILKTIYNSLISCHLNYGILVWGQSLGPLEKLQKRAIRLLTNSKYNAHTNPLFKSMKILKIEDMRRIQELVFFYKFSKNMLPVYFKTEYIRFLESNYTNRHRFSLLFPRFRHEYFRQNLRYSIVNTINNAPITYLEKVHTHSLKGFRNYIKNDIISKYPEVCLIPNCYICRNSSN